MKVCPFRNLRGDEKFRVADQLNHEFLAEFDEWEHFQGEQMHHIYFYPSPPPPSTHTHTRTLLCKVNMSPPPPHTHTRILLCKVNMSRSHLGGFLYFNQKKQMI